MQVVIRCALAALVAMAHVLGAQAADTSASEVVAPGVVHTRLVRLTGPFIVNVLAVDLRHAGLEVRHVRALGALRGRETVSAMVARLAASGQRVLAAVNADRFDLRTGESENNQVIDGEWWKANEAPHSPADSGQTVHSQFALDVSRRPLIDPFAFDGVVVLPRDTFALSAVNAVPRAPNTVALFTSRYGALDTGDSVRTHVEIHLAPVGRRADTLLFVRAAPSPDGAVMAGYEAFVRRVGRIQAHDTIRVVPRTVPRTPPLAMLVGGLPRLIRDGANVAEHAGQLEGAAHGNVGIRNPRTAVGFSRDSATLYLVTVDGRSTRSVGMTAVELADFMRELGAYQALNLDGGGSTTMVVRDRIVNSPSDTAGERTVGDALVLVQGAARGALPQLDSARLLTDLGALAADSMEGRRIGTPGGARARAFLLRALARSGVEPPPRGYAVPFTARADGRELHGVNVIGMIRGTVFPDRYIVLSAHYDHLGVRGGAIYNGADDNASGTAAVLAVAQWLRLHPPRHSIIVALFDGEEEGLLGAKAFVANTPVPRDRIAANVNLDMVSRNAKGELYASGATPFPAMKPLLDSVAAIAPVKLLLGHDSGFGDANWVQQSDQGAFASRNIPFVYFGVEDHPDYHTPGDKVEHIQPGFYYRCAQTIAEFVRRLDLVDARP